MNAFNIDNQLNKITWNSSNWVKLNITFWLYETKNKYTETLKWITYMSTITVQQILQHVHNNTCLQSSHITIVLIIEIISFDIIHFM